MRRWLPGITLVAAACAGHPRPATQPVTVATAPGIATARDTLPVLPPATTAPGMTAASRSQASGLLTVHDSAADAAALDSLARVQPAASLPDVPIDATPTWDLNVADFADQPRVKYYLDYFTGRAHDRFQIWLDRMARYEPYARAEFMSRKLPGDFVYLALIESGFAPEAVSRTYAVGIWQFMLGTGKLYGLQVDSWVDERRDPIKSTDAAAHHLDDLTQQFGSHYLAAAAYNAGAGRVQRGLGAMNSAATDEDSTAVTGDGAFFSLADTRMIRDETKNYVPQLIAAAIIAKEPTRYAFDVPHDVTPFSRDSVVVDGGTGLDLIARLADTSLDALRDLNPHLLRLVTPPDRSYPVRVPVGTADRIATAYAALAPAERHAVVAHQVRAGETVTTLAHQFDASPDLIRSANRAARGRALTAGTMLYIPVAASPAVAAMLREPDPPRTVRFVTRTVIVRAGETVASVARRAGVPAADLRNDNHLSAKAVVHVGQHLTAHRTMVVAAGRPVPSTPPAARIAVTRATATVAARPGTRKPVTNAAHATVARTHVVTRGETVTGIAGHFGVTPSALIAFNNLGRDAKVRVGQTIRIPG